MAIDTNTLEGTPTTATTPRPATHGTQDSCSDQTAIKQREEQKPASDSPTSQEGQGVHKPVMTDEAMFERIGRLSREIEIALDTKSGSPWVRVSAGFAMSVPVLLEGGADADLLKALDRGIEDLIALRDAIDGDPDLEPSFGYLPPGIPDEAEPEACFERTWRETGTRMQTGIAMQPDDRDDDEDGHDLEAVNEDGGDINDEPQGCSDEDGNCCECADREPSLGSYDRMVDQRLSYVTPKGEWNAGREEGETPLDRRDAAWQRWRQGDARYNDPVADARRQLNERRFGAKGEHRMVDAGGGHMVPLVGVAR